MLKLRILIIAIVFFSVGSLFSAELKVGSDTYKYNTVEMEWDIVYTTGTGLLIRDFMNNPMFEYDANGDIMRSTYTLCYDPNYEFDENGDVQPKLIFWSRNDENDIQPNTE